MTSRLQKNWVSQRGRLVTGERESWDYLQNIDTGNATSTQYLIGLGMWLHWGRRKNVPTPSG